MHYKIVGCTTSNGVFEAVADSYEMALSVIAHYAEESNALALNNGRQFGQFFCNRPNTVAEVCGVWFMTAATKDDFALRA